MTKVAVVVGSIRPNRNGSGVAEHVAERANTIPGVEATLIDLAELNLPMFAEPTPPAYAAPQNPAAQAWLQAISEADAVIFVSPEYNHSVPGVLKNAIDYLTPASLANKAVASVTYGAVGGVRAAEHLRQIFGNFNADTIAKGVTYSLFTDFQNMSEFAPSSIHDGEVEALVESLVERTGALAALR